jgi:hypothetical protein
MRPAGAPLSVGGGLHPNQNNMAFFLFTHAGSSCLKGKIPLPHHHPRRTINGQSAPMNLPFLVAIIILLHSPISIYTSAQEPPATPHIIQAAAMSIPTRPSLAIATRLHLGHASHPPPPHQLHSTLINFADLARDVRANIAIVAVDAEERIEGYSLVSHVESICQEINDGRTADAHECGNATFNDNRIRQCRIEVIPIQPWGKFVPALNAIVAYSARKNMQCLLLASAEVSIRGDVMEDLWKEMNLDDTLVVGEFFRIDFSFCMRDIFICMILE